MEALVKSCNICWVMSGMPNALLNNKAPIFLVRLELYCLFFACSYTSMEFTVLPCLVGYVPSCPKLSEITNHQYLWKGLSDFVDFLHVVICILLDIH